jgi:hypothetical protein
MMVRLAAAQGGGNGGSDSDRYELCLKGLTRTLPHPGTAKPLAYQAIATLSQTGIGVNKGRKNLLGMSHKSKESIDPCG